jgi:lipoprotein-anchoring transpeptidase ErfK/SrfK
LAGPAGILPLLCIHHLRSCPVRGIAGAFLTRMASRAISSLFAITGFSFLSVSSAWSDPTVVISVPEQKLAIVENGLPVAEFPVSTSKFGLGDKPSSYATPTGTLMVAGKVGAGAKPGTVFKGCRPTGEVIRPNAPGRDPIVTRILRLKGLQANNARAYRRGIYIHGTPQENRIGRPASYGCIRMRSRDVMRVFDAVPVGTKVEIVNTSLNRVVRETAHEKELATRG